MAYLWLKLLHIFFIIAWFAGLFYLPRIYVNLAQAPVATTEYNRLLGMAKRLFKFMTPLGVLALIFGIIIPIIMDWWSMGWVHSKVTIGVILLAYQGYCWKLLQDFQQNRNMHSHKWYRYFNEIPVVIMAFALYLVIFKPF